jgi:hypothetical protein
LGAADLNIQDNLVTAGCRLFGQVVVPCLLTHSLNSGALHLDQMGVNDFPFGFVTVSISASPAAPETTEIVRFLHRFADLMSTGSNSDNLLRAAQLLEAHIDRVKESNELLQVERVRSDANSELRRSLEEKIARSESEIGALKSQLSEQQLKLSEVVAESERQKNELLHRAEQAEAELAVLQNDIASKAPSDTHILVPLATLRVAMAQFEALARAFEGAGNIVSQVMCKASATTLERTMLDAGAPAEDDRSQHAA